MRFQETKLQGVWEVDIEPHTDDRGFFARTWCQREFEQLGFDPRLAQCSISFNSRTGTLRGLHYQADPHPECKLVRCTQGSIYDVVLDLRPGSSTFKDWIGVTLTARNRRAVLVPGGCAHGFLTLDDDTEVFYQMTEFFHGDLARGFRWNDPAFRITWPSEPVVISERDRQYPDFEKTK